MIFQKLLLSLLCLNSFFELLSYLCRQEEILVCIPRGLFFVFILFSHLSSETPENSSVLLLQGWKAGPEPTVGREEAEGRPLQGLAYCSCAIEAQREKQEQNMLLLGYPSFPLQPHSYSKQHKPPSNGSICYMCDFQRSIRNGQEMDCGYTATPRRLPALGNSLFCLHLQPALPVFVWHENALLSKSLKYLSEPDLNLGR